MTRREWIQIAAATPLSGADSKRPRIVVFSKHLAKFGYADLAKNAKQLGFDGVDLTVRPKGHVLPERAALDLPKAVEAIRAAGLEVPMITTDLQSASDPAAEPTLATAAKLKIPYFKMGYLRYDKRTYDVALSLDSARPKVAGLADLAKKHGVTMGLHNHSGDHFGAAVWDFRETMKGLDPKFTGYYFDPAHATIEGGLSGWRISLDVAARNLKMVALKDFYWEKQAGAWKLVWCPMGEGMVNWKEVFAGFARVGFTGPFSLHSEYPGGEEPEAMAKDLAFARKLVSAAAG